MDIKPECLEEAPCSSGRHHAPSSPPAQGRRGLLAGVAALTTALGAVPTAQAIKAVSADQPSGAGPPLPTALGTCTHTRGRARTRPRLPAPAPAQVTLRDGSVVAATEHALSLAIVALRGSFPNQWVMDFRSILGKYSGFTLDQRKQIVDIFKVRRRACGHAGAHFKMED